MDAIEFMDSGVVDLPKTRGGEFAPFIDQILDEYRTQMQRVNNRSFIDHVITREVSRVDELSDAIREVIGRSLAGDAAGAYNRLDQALTALGPYLRALMPAGDMSLVVNPMYRFQLDVPPPYNRGRLFHIPFHLRHKAGPMRYSVAGLPSLYLGGSTHVCWRELGEPEKARVVVSRFHAVPGTGLRVLNFGRRMALYADWVNKEPDKFLGRTNEAAVISAQIVCWPLIAACSIRVPDRAKPERPEYLVPQMVLEWITKTKAFHGVRYFSTHYPEYPDDPKTYMNYVFPVRTNAPGGYCRELCGLFELTEPLSWAAGMALPDSGLNRPQYKYGGVLDAALEGEYGRVESGLLGLPAAAV